MLTTLPDPETASNPSHARGPEIDSGPPSSTVSSEPSDDFEGAGSAFSFKVAEARDNLELTQEEAVDALADEGVIISRRSLSLYENGKAPSEKKQEAILAAYRRLAKKLDPRGAAAPGAVSAETSGELARPVTRRDPGASPARQASAVASDFAEDPMAALASRIPVPVVEVAAGPSGMDTITGATVYVDFLTPGEFVMLFKHPPPRVEGAGIGWCLALLRGESMVPRYDDGDRVPVELFDEQLGDVPGGDVFLVRLDGHLHLKVIEREPKRSGSPAVLHLKSYNPLYKPISVVLDGGTDFAVLGRVVETSKQRLFGALLARDLGL